MNPVVDGGHDNKDIEDGTIYCDKIRIVFGDTDPCRQKQFIEACGYKYKDGKAEEYRYSNHFDKITDALPGDIKVIAQGDLNITDIDLNIEVNTTIWAYFLAKKSFAQLENGPDIKTHPVDIIYEKIKNMVEQSLDCEQYEELPEDNSMGGMTM